MIRKLLLVAVLVTATLAILLRIPLPEGAAAPEPPVLLEPLNKAEAGSANLVSIQPYLTSEDYASVERLQRKLRGYLTQGRSAGWLSEQTLVVFPEHIGTWLVAEGESFLAFRSDSTTGALFWAALGNLPDFLRHWRDETAADPFAAALFKSKAGAMAEQYQQVFSTLAREFGVTLVAGSIALPSPSIERDQIRAGTGAIYNSSFVFFADGSVAGPVRKLYPIDSELPFTQPGEGPLPIIDTPLGRLGVLICADSWYPQAWRQLEGAELVAVPSYSSPDGIWDRPWGGYNGAATPADISGRDVGTLSEGEAWRKYALAGRGKHLRAGINTFFRGELWDLGDDGRTTAVLHGEVLQGERRDGAVISSLWLVEKNNGN
ncbi:Carbon-nitrogen hydrolase [Microbulbifer donghaiensis]|uniref:Carbon-nitrogen hydrolase n=1 Tax=Microbulbifer donghaiensis TaxID=494016 RepID=A0A1M5G406_9GAMM|nr:carbon-nitrogen hydrolase family protein [Microbulbifer donghaiensis]SHF98172.1 Carbon-nitrogen hydrolase [Microbulbifer donghaiensis]